MVAEKRSITFAGVRVAFAAGPATGTAVAKQVRPQRDQGRRRDAATACAVGGGSDHAAPRFLSTVGTADWWAWLSARGFIAWLEKVVVFPRETT